MNKKKDVNILILGEIGVGKSTWINGIANYAKHNTLRDAMDDPEFTVVIPSRFIFTDEEGNEIEINVGWDENEVLVSGQSATQFPREYVIETDTTKFHLIDTPGIGDCRGIEKDNENFDNILAFLTCYEKINAVVVLFKPNNARLTMAFRFCLLELMTHLHKSVVSNIIFAFTNSRGTFYRPGDSLLLLKKLLQEKKIETNLSPKSYFCFDNEAFRFLACFKNGINFMDEEVDLYSRSWVKSCETTCKLFQLVTTMQPHETKETISLNRARSCIIAMSKPMGQAVELIEKNVRSKNDAKDQCKRADADTKSKKEALINELETHVKELKEEKEAIYYSASFFGFFLKQNALVPYNDSVNEYLDMLIREEEAKEEVIRDIKRIYQLKNEKRRCGEKKSVIMKSITSSFNDKSEVIPIEEMEKMIRKLCSLKHNGKTLNEALAAVTRHKSHQNGSTNVVIAKNGKFAKFTETVSDAMSRLNPRN